MSTLWWRWKGKNKEMMSLKSYCVYKHVAPDGRVYIGITSNNPIKRWQSGTGYKGNSYFTRAIKKYGWDNFQHIIIADGLDEQSAKEMEIEMIADCKSNIRKYGFNISSGGESKKGTKISEWQKQRISEASKNRIVSAETREKLSRSSRIVWSNPDFVTHMRQINLGEKNPQFGKHLSDNERLQRGAKVVLQYDLNGNLIAEYISLHAASEQANVSRDVISKCCRGIYKQGKGFIWKFKQQDVFTETRE